MQREKIDEIKSWLTKAKQDIRAAKVDLAAEPPLLEDAVFHCQQSVEKAMKGFLTSHDIVFRKTHDLDELACACAKVDSALKTKLDPAKDLTTYAWEFRYPGESEEISLDEVNKALQTAKEVYGLILERMPSEVKNTITLR